MVNREIEQRPSNPELDNGQETGVFILAGGKGSRLKKSDDPELQNMPKPLVQIDSVRGRLTMLDNAINGVLESGIPKIILLTSADPEAQGDLIENHVVESYLETVSCIRENQPLGTAGAVYNAFVSKELTTAAIIPADTLFPFNYLPIILERHTARGAEITWVVTTNPGENAQNTGRILVNTQNGLVVYALEGNPNVDIASHIGDLIPSTSVGVVIANRNFYMEQYKIFLGEENKVGAIDLYRHFIPWLLSQGVQVSTYDIGQPAPDLGTPDRLKQFGRNR